MVNVWLFVTHVRQKGSDSLEAPHRSHYNICTNADIWLLFVKPTASTPRTLWLLIKIKNECDACCKWNYINTFSSPFSYFLNKFYSYHSPYILQQTGNENIQTYQVEAAILI